MHSAEDIFRNFLQKEFDASKLKNSRYSMRSFAGKLGLAGGTLSDLLSGKTKLSSKRMAEIVEKLNLTPHKKSRMLKAVGFTETVDGADKVDPIEHYFLADWFHRSVLFLFDLGEIASSADPVHLISKKLGVERSRIDQCVKVLLQKNLLEKQADGSIHRPQNLWKTTDGDVSEFVRRHHISNLEVTKLAFEKVPAHERDFTFMMFAGNASQIEALRAEVRRFYEKVLLIMENGERDELYQIAVSLYPINDKVMRRDG